MLRDAVQQEATELADLNEKETTSIACDIAASKDPDPLAAIRTRIASFFTNLAPTCDEDDSTHRIVREDVEGVDGAYILHNVLSSHEYNELALSTEELVLTNVWDNGTSRRAGAFHTPCMVEPRALNSICYRLREHLPSKPGPQHSATLEAPGAELSPFLRCYSYGPEEYSGLHYDKSQTKHDEIGYQTSFTGFSVLIYLKGSDSGCVGGRTLFYPKANLKRTSSGKGVLGGRGVLVSADDSEGLGSPIGIDPKEGDVLIFPHGRHGGCYPDPLHEGEHVVSGRKTIIRTDIVYVNPARATSNKVLRKNRTTANDKKASAYELMISRSEISETFLRNVAGFINAAPDSQADSFVEHERAFMASKENTSEWIMAGATGAAFRVLFERHESYLSVCLSCPGKLNVIAKQQVWEAYRASGGNVTIHPRPEDTAVPAASSKKSKSKKGVKEDLSFLDEAVLAGKKRQ